MSVGARPVAASEADEAFEGVSTGCSFLVGSLSTEAPSFCSRKEEAGWGAEGSVECMT